MSYEFGELESTDVVKLRPELADYPHLAADLARFQRTQQILKAAELRQLSTEIPASYVRDDNIRFDPLSHWFVLLKTLQQHGAELLFTPAATGKDERPLSPEYDLAVYRGTSDDTVPIIDALLEEDPIRMDMLGAALDGYGPAYQFTAYRALGAYVEAGKMFDDDLIQRLFMTHQLRHYCYPESLCFYPGNAEAYEKLAVAGHTPLEAEGIYGIMNGMVEDTLQRHPELRPQPEAD